MQVVGEKVFSFQGFTLDLKRGALRHGDREIELRPKSFAVLRYLVENAGRLVSKDELIRAIWPNVIVTDESLTRCVSDIRLALRDAEQRIIKTAPRRGYLLVAPVSEAKARYSPTAMVAPLGEGGPDRARSEKRPAERRQLTVLACDILGLAALSTRLDPEDLSAATAACHHCCAEIIERHHGYIASYLADGVLAYFGYPEAHEHDAENAVRAGLTLIGSAAQLGAGLAAKLEPRIGIASGTVVIGDEPGAAAVREQTAVGETPNLAGRLQAVAEARGLVIADSTHRLVGGMFEYRDLGRVTLAGLAEPVQAWQVLSESAVESRFRAQHGTSLTPLVGREEELELLMRRWQRAKAGEGSVVAISGEAGIGKSRLVVTLEGRVRAEPHTTLRYFCSPHHVDSPLYAFHPITAQFARAAGFESHDTSDVKLDKLASLLRASAFHERDVPLVAELLSIPLNDRYPPVALSPKRKREKTLEALLAPLEGVSRQRPVLTTLEDIHWIDPSSRELLEMTIERVSRQRVLLVVTFRPEFVAPWIGEAHVTTLNLCRLDRREGAAMARLVAGNRSLSAQTLAEIVAHADGIPLFVEELTKAVVEAGAPDESGTSTARSPLLASAVPVTLQASLIARLDRLGPLTSEIAQIGAVIGREFSYELLAAVAQESDGELQSALNRLTDAGLVSCRGVPPLASFLFKHALVRDAAYGCLLRDRRRALHARTASMLEQRFPEIAEQQPELLALHCAEAGLKDKAADYCLRAGQQALARSAMTEAVVHLRKGLDLLAEMPVAVEYQRRELDLQLALGGALIATRGYADSAVAAAYARARELSQQLKRPSQLVQAVYGRCAYRNLRAELVLAREDAQELLDLGEARNDPVVRLSGCIAAALTLFHLGDFAASRAFAERALELHDPVYRPFYDVRDQEILSLALLSRALCFLGYLDQARARCDEAEAKARRSARAFDLAYVLGHACMSDFYLQSETNLLRHAEELSSLCAERGFPHWGSIAMLYRGWCMSAAGTAEAGLAMLLEGLEAYRATGANMGVPGILVALADRYGRAGRPKEGLKQLDEAARLVATTRERYADAHAHQVRGDLLVSMGDCAAAEASFSQASDIARGQGTKLLELNAVVSLARFWRDQGRRSEARELLAPIYAWFTEGFDTPALREAKTLLDELRRSMPQRYSN